MATPLLVQADTGPDLIATLHEKDNISAPLVLTDATVRFQMRKADDRRYTVNAPATIINAATGRVKYSWAPNDLAVPGDYEVQFEVTWPGGVIQTTSVPAAITVRRQ